MRAWAHVPGRPAFEARHQRRRATASAARPAARGRCARPGYSGINTTLIAQNRASKGAMYTVRRLRQSAGVGHGLSLMMRS